MSDDATIAGFTVGSQAEFDHVITAEDIQRFAELTGDDNPLHVNREFAERTSFKGIVAHGMLSASFISTIIGKYIPGPGALWMSQAIEFLLPVRIGDRLRIRAEVTAVQASQRILTLRTEIQNQHDQLVLRGESKVRVLELPAEPARAAADGIRVVVVTGGSRGIGADTARRLARDGFAVVVNYLNDAASAEHVVGQIERDEGRAISVRADVAKPSDVERLIETAVKRFGGLTALVHNASHPLVYKPFETLSADDLVKQMEIHYYAAYHLVRAALPHLSRAENASVVCIGTVATDDVPPLHLAAYTAAKAALTSLTKSLAVEYGPKGIRFNIVAPGMTGTAMIAGAPEKAKLIAKMQTPLRRLAEPEDIAEAIAFLVSPRARHITGETLRVCGGTVMQ